VQRPGLKSRVASIKPVENGLRMDVILKPQMDADGVFGQPQGLPLLLWVGRAGEAGMIVRTVVKVSAPPLPLRMDGCYGFSPRLPAGGQTIRVPRLSMCGSSSTLWHRRSSLQWTARQGRYAFRLIRRRLPSLCRLERGHP
jgi:hypothetical protein